jgi:hypothetical protein
MSKLVITMDLDRIRQDGISDKDWIDAIRENLIWSRDYFDDGANGDIETEDSRIIGEWEVV